MGFNTFLDKWNLKPVFRQMELFKPFLDKWNLKPFFRQMEF